MFRASRSLNAAPLQVRDLEDINYTNDLLVEGAKEQELELREDLDLSLAKCREVGYSVLAGGPGVAGKQTGCCWQADRVLLAGRPGVAGR